MTDLKGHAFVGSNGRGLKYSPPELNLGFLLPTRKRQVAFGYSES